MRILTILGVTLCMLGCAGKKQVDFEHLSARVRSLVVRVEAGGDRTASGFFVSESRVVTLASAVTGTEEIRLRAPDGSWTLARLVASDSANDLALLEPVPPPSVAASPLEFAKVLPRPGARVLIAGYPGEYGLSVLLTSVTATGVPLESDPAEELLLLQSAAQQGLGGAPVIDGKGIVIGIVRTGDGGFTSTLSASVLKGSLSHMLAGDNPEGPDWVSLGVDLREVSEVRALRVESLESDGAAARAGLLAGDLIVGIGGRRAESLDFASALLRSWRSERAIPLVVQRELQQLRLNLARPAAQ